MKQICNVHNSETEWVCSQCHKPICSLCVEEQKAPEICVVCEREGKRQELRKKAKELEEIQRFSIGDRLKDTKTVMRVIAVSLVILIMVVIYVATLSRSGKAKDRLEVVASLMEKYTAPRYESRYLVQMINTYHEIYKKYPVSLSDFSPKYISETKLERLNSRYVYTIDRNEGFVIKATDPKRFDIGKSYLTPEDAAWSLGE